VKLKDLELENLTPEQRFDRCEKFRDDLTRMITSVENKKKSYLHCNEDERIQLALIALWQCCNTWKPGDGSPFHLSLYRIMSWYVLKENPKNKGRSVSGRWNAQPIKENIYYVPAKLSDLLDEDDYKLMELKIVYGLFEKDIAKIYGVSKSRIGQKIEKVRERVRQVLVS